MEIPFIKFQKKSLSDAIARWRHPIFVWGVWAGMFVAALLFVARYGHNVPYYDEWSLVYTLAGTHAIDLEWLWYPRNGHRIAVPKLVLIALLPAAGWDFRTSMYVSVILLGAASGALIWAACRYRGETSYADAIFPLLWLNWGHYDNMIWGWQLTQVLPIAVAGLLLGAVARWRLNPPFPIAVLASIGVVTLPLSGVPGLALTPGFALWLLEIGRRRWQQRRNKPRQEAAVLWMITSLALLLVPAYFVDLRNTGVSSPDLISSARTSLSFLAHGFGPAAEALRPWSTLIILILFTGATFALLQALWVRGPGRRSHALALLFPLIAFAGIALSVGIARPGYAFPHRYYLFAVPALSWLCLATHLARHEGIARGGRVTLLALALLAVVYNTSVGLGYASARSAAMATFEADMRAGVPPSQLIARHQRALLPFPEDGGAYWHEPLEFCFDVLSRNGIGAFEALAPEPIFHEVDIRKVAELSFMDDAETAVLEWLWTLVEVQHIAGVRIMHPRLLLGDDARSELEWARNSAEPFSRDRRYVHWWMEHEISATVWIYDTVSTLRIALPANGTVSDAPELRLLIVADE
jgi:hypothetical protein